jgi:hypothetical protein
MEPSMDFNDYLLPLVIAKTTVQLPNITYTIDRYAGVAFFIDDHATVVTCAHVVDMVQKDETLLGMDPVTGSFAPVLNVRRHSKYDFAVGVFPSKPGYKCFRIADRAIGPGTDVAAFGFTSNGRQGQDVKVDARIFKGHVVRYASEPAKSDARSTLELSFPSHKGFSGSALVDANTRDLVGMMFSNLESTIELHSFTDIDEDGSRYKESMHRIIELGLAHTNRDLLEFLKEFQQ